MPLLILGTALDLRTNTPVIYCQAGISEYLNLVGDDFGNFTIQRRRETHKAYKRLKEDIKSGALLPSITLAVKPEVVAGITPMLAERGPALIEALSKSGQADILDGLQRTYIMNDLRAEGHVFSAEQKVLIEFWLEADLQKLIYRIIVLNAGQKPMSIRHQVELLFMSLKTSIESRIPELEIYTEREQTRRRRSRKFPLGFVVSAYQAYITHTTELQKENLIASKMQIEGALDASEKEISEQFEAFIHYLHIYSKLDDDVFRVYSEDPMDIGPDPIETSEYSTSQVQPKDMHWLSTENVMVSFFAAISQFTLDDNPQNAEIKSKRLRVALNRFEEALVKAEPGSDPLNLEVFNRVRLGTNPRKVNVGTATRRLLSNGFKEYFRAEGDISMSQAWQLAAE